MESQATVQAVKTHLGRSITIESINHYEILGVPPDATIPEIRLALKSAAAAWNASDRKSNPESALLVAQLLKQAQAELLDENLRKQYDQKLLQPVMSERDLFRTFEPSECQANSSNQSLSMFGDANSRWSELQNRIPELNDIPTPAQVDLPSYQPPPIPVAAPANRAKDLMRVEQLKRSRRNKNRLYLAGVFGAAFLFLAFAGGWFLLNRRQVLINAELAKANIDPVGAGLKSKAGDLPEDTDRVLSPPVRNKNDRISKTETTEPTPSGLPTLSKDPSDGPDPSLAMSMGDPLDSMPMSDKSDEMASMPTSTPDMASEPEPEPMMPAKPSMESMKSWSKAMKDARAAVDAADFPRFKEHIEAAISLSTTDEMVAKNKRLDQLGQLYEVFITATKDSKKKLRASEVLNVGKRKISIVEIKEMELIVRVDGKNEKYPWDRLPLGIALALADLNLNDEGPTDLAARAVYCSLSPAKNELSEKRAKEFFEKSVGKGEIRADLVQALTDTYE